MDKEQRNALRDIAAKAQGFAHWNALLTMENPNQCIIYVATEVNHDTWQSTPIGTYSTPYRAKAACWLHLQNKPSAYGRATLKFTDYGFEIEGDSKFTHYHIEFVELDEMFNEEMHAEDIDLGV